MKAAQAFMLIVVQIGRTKPETLLRTRMFSSAQRIVTGSVPAEDFEKKATVKAGSIARKVFTGEIPFTRRIAGRITKICRRFAVMIAAK